MRDVRRGDTDYAKNKKWIRRIASKVVTMMLVLVPAGIRYHGD